MGFPSRCRRRLMVAVGLLAGAMLPGPVVAGEAAVAEVQRAAYEADYRGGIARLKAMAAADRNDVEAVFGLGALQFIGAFANLQEGLFRHSTNGPPPQPMGLLAAMGPMPGWTHSAPMLVPPNPKATPMTYRALRGIIERFVNDLAAAEATLAQVKDRPVKITLQPSRIALDLDQNGVIEPTERLFEAIFAMARQDLTFAFDTADASWLRGYSHLLMASANLALAFDFERSYETSGHNSYGYLSTVFGREMQRQSAIRRSPEVLQGLIKDLDARIAAMREDDRARQAERTAIHKRLSAVPRGPEGAEERRAIQEEMRVAQQVWARFSAEQQRLYAERRQLQAELAGQPPGHDWAWVLDAIASIHTMSWNVVEPARLRAVRTHLLQVMALNRNTWRLVRAETDDDREWLPGASQTSPFGVRLTDEIIDSWLATTALAEQVLEGRKLLPHPRFRNKGVNLKKLLESARHVDVVLLVTGHGLLPYLEEGDIVDGETWQTLTRPMQHDMLRFAVWFN